MYTSKVKHDSAPGQHHGHSVLVVSRADVLFRLRYLCPIIWLLTGAAGFAAGPALIPQPVTMQVRTGAFTLCPQTLIGAPGLPATTILSDNNSLPTAQYLAASLSRSTGYLFPSGTNSAGLAVRNAILLTTNNALPSLGSEGYELTVAPDSVVIRAPTQTGLFYGVQSLLQLMAPQAYAQRPATNVQWTIPCVYIKDFPRFPWRGWMLDSVRHFFTVDEVKKLLDSMAFNKLNMFHWHLADDSGWRLEIKNWPLLTEVGAWRTNIMFALNKRSSTAWRESDGLYGGYYTQDDVRGIVDYAAQRHITIVPEVEMPGHSTAALTSYPQFSCNGGVGDCLNCSNVPHSLSVTAYVGGVFCAARPETMAFLQSVLTEVMGLFPGPYIHIGGDEVNFGNWRKHSLDEALTNSLGTADMQVYQGHFTQQIANWVKSQGRTMMGWSEIENGGTITNAAVDDWLNTKAVQAATNRQPVVMANSAVLYINKWETGSSAGNGNGVIWSNEPPAQSGFCPLTNVYNYEPIPTNLPAAYTNYILGAEGPDWSEWIPSLTVMEFRMNPRLSAVAEMCWTPAYLKDFNSFSNRLVIQKQRWTQMGVNFNPSGTPPILGTWTNSQITSSNFTNNPVTLSWDITTNITVSGEVDVSFCWKTGANGLDIAWAALDENGTEIDRDTHVGFTGASPTEPLYILHIPNRRPTATYTLRAAVGGRGGTNSNGTVYFPNWN